MKNTSLLLIAEPLGPETIVIGGLQLLRCTGVSLNDMMRKPPIGHSNQATYTVTIRGHGDWNVSLNRLESRPDVQRVGIRWRSNDGIYMNPPGTIGGKFPHITVQGNLTSSTTSGGYLFFYNRSAFSWHCAEIT